MLVGTACSGEMTFSDDVALSGDAACGQAFDDVIAAVGDGVDGMVGAVPDAIRADVRLLVDAYGDAVAAWLQTGDGPEDGALDTPELQAAEDRVAAWLETHCADGSGAPTID
jgi:hypothetical protein